MSGSRLERLAVPAATTFVMVAILVGLGVWQLERLAWKRGLLAQVAEAQAAEPVPLGEGSPKLFTRVRVQGILRPLVALYGAEVRDEGAASRMGAQLIEVLERPGEAPLLVDLGWVPVERGASPHPVSGAADLVGYVRLPERPGPLSASDDLAGRHFYALNPVTIGASLGAADVAPFTVVAMGAAAQVGGPVPATALPEPVNNHLSYALTWFGLAGSLLGVFAVWARKRLSGPS